MTTPAEADLSAAVEGDPLLIEMARALHSHLPEDRRPVARMDFSDDQWARLEAAAAVARGPAETRTRKGIAVAEAAARAFDGYAEVLRKHGLPQLAPDLDECAAALRHAVSALGEGSGPSTAPASSTDRGA